MDYQAARCFSAEDEYGRRVANDEKSFDMCYKFKKYKYKKMGPTTSCSGTTYDGFTTADLLAYTRFSFNLKPNRTKASSTKELTDFLTIQWPSDNVLNALSRMGAVIDTRTGARPCTSLTEAISTRRREWNSKTRKMR